VDLLGNSTESDVHLDALIAAYTKLTNSQEPYEQVVGSLCVAGNSAPPEKQTVVGKYFSKGFVLCSPTLRIFTRAV
jgi:hypothetical protein